ncbi:MAG: hypothetical protein QNJ36_19820 [Calothrix sp. MO_167.B42]|nr:hypothetical protein [Calothrix sp. MO_167.B42]
MPPKTGYAIADINAIKAIPPEDRADGYSRLAKSYPSTDPAWYTFIEASTANGDDDLVLLPNDNPTTGRWHKSSGAGGGSGGGGSNLTGAIVCTTACGRGGKGFSFDAPQTVEIEAVPGFGISIASGATSIEVHRWDRTPTTSMDGRQFVAHIPHTGGKATVTIDNTYRWISFFARNPSNGNAYDGVCFINDGNVFTLLGYS